MKESQKQFVIRKLREDGYISRNDCLRNYITRLGARCNDLQREGWKLEGEFIKTEHGKDYVYRLIKAPELRLF